MVGFTVITSRAWKVNADAPVIRLALTLARVSHIH